MWRWREFLRWRALKLPLTKVLVEWMTFKETRLSTTLSHFSFSFLCSSSFSFCSLLSGRETLVVCLQSSYYWKKHKGLSHFWKCHQAWITECVPEQCALMVALSEWVSERWKGYEERRTREMGKGGEKHASVSQLGEVWKEEKKQPVNKMNGAFTTLIRALKCWCAEVCVYVFDN